MTSQPTAPAPTVSIEITDSLTEALYDTHSDVTAWSMPHPGWLQVTLDDGTIIVHEIPAGHRLVITSE